MNISIRNIINHPAFFVVVLALLLGAGRASAQQSTPPPYACPPGSIPDPALLSASYKGQCGHCLTIQPTVTPTQLVLGTQPPTRTPAPTLQASYTPVPTSTPVNEPAYLSYVDELNSQYDIYSAGSMRLVDGFRTEKLIATGEMSIVALVWSFDNPFFYPPPHHWDYANIYSQPSLDDREDLWAGNPPALLNYKGCASADPFGNGMYSGVCDDVEFFKYVKFGIGDSTGENNDSFATYYGGIDFGNPMSNYNLSFGLLASFDEEVAQADRFLDSIGEVWLIVDSDAGSVLPTSTPTLTFTPSITPTASTTPLPAVYVGATQTCTIFAGNTSGNPNYCTFSAPGSAAQEVVGYRMKLTYTRLSGSPSAGVWSCSSGGDGYIKLNPSDANCDNSASTEFSGVSGLKHWCMRLNSTYVPSGTCAANFPGETFTHANNSSSVYPTGVTFTADLNSSFRMRMYNSCPGDCGKLELEFQPILYGIADPTPTGTAIGTASPTPTITNTPTQTFTRTPTRTPIYSLTPLATSQYPDWYDENACIEWDYLVTATPSASPSPSTTPTPTMTVTPDITLTSAWVTGTSSTDGTATDIAATQWMAATSTIISETSTAGFQQTATQGAIMGTAVAGTYTQEAITATPGIQQTQTYEYVGTAAAGTQSAQSTASAGSFTGTPNPDYWGTGTDELVNDADGVGTGRGGFVGIDARMVSVSDGACYLVLPKVEQFRMNESTSVCVKWVNLPTMNIFGLLLPLDIIIVLPFFSIVRRLWSVPTS